MATSRRLTTDWYNRDSLTQMLDKIICVGDVLEFKREDESNHWAIYTGIEEVNGWKRPFVIHCCGDCCQKDLPGTSVVESLLGTGKDAENMPYFILKECLTEIIGKDEVRISNYLDTECEPYLGDEIVERANSQMTQAEEAVTSGSENYVKKYFFSCQHFVLWCRYDENYLNMLAQETAEKAENIKKGIMAVGAGVAAAGLGYFLWSKLNKEEKKEDSLKEQKK